MMLWEQSRQQTTVALRHLFREHNIKTLDTSNVEAAN